MRQSIVLTLLCFIVFCRFATAQGEVGLIAGISNYQGDLSSYNLDNGFKALIGPVIGVHSGYALNRRFMVRADVLYTRIAGNDDLADNPNARARNLDFFAPVIQFAPGMDWYIFGFDADRQGSFTPYGSVGGSIFYFNPSTTYQGEKVSLHPLGTEGQFLADYPDQEPYSRFQVSLQFGGGLKWMATERLILSMEAMLSYTFTDYLDDVSTIYITYPELLEKAGPLTAALANREGEALGTGPAIVNTGSARGNPGTKDYFGVITIRASIPVSFWEEKFKIRRHNNKTIPNPKF